jgi:multicomponent Na+:H+ antiporter subunit E
LLLAVVWWLLTEGDNSSWLIGVPVILAATVSTQLLPAWRPGYQIRPAGLLWLVPAFVVRSLVAGIDVSRRALSKRCDLQPGFVDYHLELPHGLARVVFVNVTSLLPGTLAADLACDRLTLHVLDQSQPHERSLRFLERLVGAVFHVPRTASPGGSQ